MAPTVAADQRAGDVQHTVQKTAAATLDLQCINFYLVSRDRIDMIRCTRSFNSGVDHHDTDGSVSSRHA